VKSCTSSNFEEYYGGDVPDDNICYVSSGAVWTGQTKKYGTLSAKELKMASTSFFVDLKEEHVPPHRNVVWRCTVGAQGF